METRKSCNRWFALLLVVVLFVSTWLPSVAFAATVNGAAGGWATSLKINADVLKNSSQFNHDWLLLCHE